ncbi:MAG: hypothetical protein LBU76_06590 [Azoarcus sp.]|jgi:pilus assembly protein FimV|nr:hypothetical protein [Azoarcus sp.]
MKPIIKASLIAAAISFLPFSAQAAGLGQYSVRSKLGEPLNVEIQINATQQELQSLTARIAPADAFQQGGVPYASFVPNVKVAVENRGDRSVLKLSSDIPVNEAVASLVVQLNWDDGRVSRTYNILLDPPDVDIRPPAPVEPIVTQPAPLPIAETPPASLPMPELTAEPVPEPTPEPAPTVIEQPPIPEQAPSPYVQEPVPEPAPVPDMPPERPPVEPERLAPPPAPSYTPSYSEADGSDYAVKKGDTLGSIARGRAPLDVSLDQMMVALHRANPSAFIDNNINRLRTGVILKMPSADEARNISNTEARREVRVQTQAFNDWRARVAGEVVSRPAVPAEESAGRTRTIDTVPPVAEQDRDRVAISSGDASGQGGNADRLRQAEENAAAALSAQKEAESRVKELEDILKAQEKLIVEKEKEARKQQQTAAAQTPAPTPAPVVAAEPPPAPVPPPAPEQPAAPAEPPVAQPPQEPAAPPVEEAPQEPVAEEPAAPLQVETDSAPEPYQDPLMEKLTDPQILGGFALVIAILAIFLGIRSRKKRADMGLYTLSQDATSMFPEDATSIFGDNGGQNVDTSASSVIHTDFSQTGLSIDTNEGVDPVAEADVYMAYGRDSQAEEILNDALKVDPKRGAIYVKLLEIYAQRQDLKQFEEKATELFSITQGQGRDWEKAAQMGRRLDPSNPLYSGKSSGQDGNEVSRLPGLEPAIEETTRMDLEAEKNPANSGATLSDLDFGVSSAPSAPAVKTGTDERPKELAGDAVPAAAAQPKRQEAATPSEVDFQFEPAETEPKAPGSIDFDLGKSQSTSEAGKQPISVSAPKAVGVASRTAGRKSALPKSTKNLTDPLDFDLPVGSQDVASGDMSATVVLPSAQGGSERGDDVMMDLEKTSFDPNALDFDLDLDDVDSDTATASVAPARDGKAKGSQSRVPAGNSAAAAADTEEVDTKLELALAYGDMGDTEGALGLLREVMAEGNAAQKAEAKALIAKMG